MKDTYMILNGVDVGVSKVELDEWDIEVIDGSKKNKFVATVKYNWKDLNTIKVGEEKKIEFDEYVITEYDECALIVPTISYVKRIDENIYLFHFKCDDVKKKGISYISKKGHFEKEINSYDIEAYINYEDVKGKSIKYEF